MFPIESHLRTKFPWWLHPCPSIQLDEILLYEWIDLNFCEGQGGRIQRVLEYLYQAHEAETMMLAVHTSSMSPFVRQDVEIIRELILHILSLGRLQALYMNEIDLGNASMTRFGAASSA